MKDIGNLVAAIDGAKDVAALDFHKGAAVHLSCCATPNSRPDRIETATAAIEFSEEGVTVSTSGAAICRLVKRAIRVIRVYRLTIKDIVHIVMPVIVTIRPGMLSNFTLAMTVPSCLVCPQTSGLSGVFSGIGLSPAAMKT